MSNYLTLIINLLASFTTLFLINLIYLKKNYFLLCLFTIISFISINLANLLKLNIFYFMIDLLIMDIYLSLLLKHLKLKDYLITILIIIFNLFMLLESIMFNFNDLNFSYFIILSRICFLFTLTTNKLCLHLYFNFFINFAFIFLILTSSLYLDLLLSNHDLSLMLMIIVVFTIIIIALFKESYQQSKLLYQKQLLLNVLEEKKKNYYLSKETIKQTKKIKHDLHHLLNNLLYELDQQHYQNCRKIILSQLNELNNFQRTVISGNDVIDYCIALQSKLIEEKNIRITCDNLELIPIDNEDLFIVFGNLFQNALENCKPNPKCQVMVSAGIIEEFFYLTIKNTINEAILNNNPHLLTSKENKDFHGLGIISCQKIIEKYHGKLFFDQDNLFFSAKILIPNHQ